MNRKIKFRGIAENNDSMPNVKKGEWVYGWLVNDTIIQNKIPVKIVLGTRGQYTGLSDKNGIEIYDGDIVKGVAESERSFIYGGERVAFIGLVRWDIEDTGFFYESDQDDWPHITPFFTVNVEVIGNIHENHELLEKL